MAEEVNVQDDELENPRLTDETLSKAEDVLRDHGYAYPFCWAIWFLAFHKDELIHGLKTIGEQEEARHLADLIEEIETGITK